MESRRLLTSLVVTTTSDAGLHSGESLRDAVATANTDAKNGVSDTITFDSGLDGQTIVLVQGELELGQGGAGSGTITINGGGQITVSGQSDHLFFEVDNDASAALVGLTIDNGEFDDLSGINNDGSLTVSNSTISGSSGPGIDNDGTLTVNSSTISNNAGDGIDGTLSTLTVNNSTISNNGGEGIYGGTVTVSDSTISDNSAGGIDSGALSVSGSTITGNIGGAGIDSDGFDGSGRLKIESSTISDNSDDGVDIDDISTATTIDNSTISDNGSYGIANYYDISALTVSNCAVTGNLDSGIYNAGTMTVNNSTVSENSLPGNNAGGIENDSGTLTVSNSTISGNTGDDAGGIENYNGTLTVSNSTISGNIGRGISNESFGALTVINSTISGNSASYEGGGIWTNSTLTVSYSTISSNTTSSGSGGGIFNNSSNDTVNLWNVIAADNAAPTGPDFGGSVTAGSNNLIGNGSGMSGLTNGASGNQVGTSATPIDPELAPLANYGGTTQTMALQPNSPAINAGGPLTTLTNAIGASDTTIAVIDAPAIASTPGGYVILVDNEQMLVTNVDLTHNTLTVQRGYNGTAAAAHTINANLYPATDQAGRFRAGSYDIGASKYLVITTSQQFSLPLNQTVTGELTNLFTEDTWTFSGLAGQQVQFVLGAVGSSSIFFDLTGTNGYTGFTNLSSSSGLITLPASGTYTVSVHSSGAASSYAYSFEVQQKTVNTLATGTPFQGTLAGSGQAQLFAVTVASPAVLNLVLSDANAHDQNEVYVSLGTPPTRDRYQYRYSALGANQAVALQAQAGTYYVLVYNNLVTTPGNSFTLDAEEAPFALTSVTPGQLSNGQSATLLVTGIFPLAYQSATAYQVQFLSAGGTVYPSTPLYLAPTGNAQNPSGSITMAATLPAGTLAAGTYSTRVTDSQSNTQTLTNTLVVTASGAGVLTTSVSVPNPVAYGEASTIYVTYSNTGNAPMPAPLLVLTAVQDGLEGALLSLDPSLAGKHYVTTTDPAGFSQSVQFLASGAVPGILNPGETVRVAVYYAGWLQSQWDLSRPPIDFSVGELDTTNTATIDWSSIAPDMRPDSISMIAWNAITPTLTAQLGSTWGQYVQTLDNDAVYLAGIGEPTTDLNSLLTFEVEKANAAFAAPTPASITADDLPAPGMDLAFVQSLQQSISGRYTSGILGYGWTTNWDYSATKLANGDVSIDNDGATLYFSLQPNGSFAAMTGEQGATLTVSGGLYQLVTADDTTYQFNSNGTLNYFQDTHGNRITAGYNGQNQLVSLTDSNGEFLDLAYNAQGFLATLSDSAGQTETYAYDATGRLTSYADAYGTTTYSYVSGQSAAENGAPSEIAYADGTHVYFGYDGQGRLIDEHGDGGQEDETWTYLSPGGYTTSDALGNQSTVYSNLYGAPAETIDALGNVTRYYYDGNLNLTKVIGPGGLTDTYAYDANGNLTSTVDPLGLKTTFTYNANNDLTGYTDAKGNTTSYAYNSADDLLSTTYANGTTQQYKYNPLGEATQYLNARGDAIGYTYNADGLLTGESFAGGTSYSYKYDALGNLTSATDASNNVTTFVYGDASNPDLLTEVDYPDGTWLKFSYNVVGQRTQSVDQTGFTTNYSYDALGRLSKLTDSSDNLIVQYTYDAAGNLIQKDNGNGTRTVCTYDKDGNVLSITNYAPDHATVNSFDDYTYDALGNVLTDTNLDGQWVYTNDADGQLTQALFTVNGANPDGLTNQNLQYVYDAAGNRTSETVNGVVTTYVTNNVNEYTSSVTAGVTTTYGYDADGNMTGQTTAGNTTTYTFNDLSQLTAVSGPGVSTSYVYDALGNRTAQTISGVTTKFQIDPAGLGNLVASYTSAGTLIAHYTYGIGLTSQVSAAGVAAYYDFDLTGNTVGITNAAGNYENKYSYLPFGETTTITAALANTFTFIGQAGVMSDFGGSFDMRGREYDAQVAQFISTDPTGIEGGDGNVRRYVGNSPIGFADPTGLAAEKGSGGKAADTTFDIAAEKLNDLALEKAKAINALNVAKAARAGNLPALRAALKDRAAIADTLKRFAKFKTGAVWLGGLLTVAEAGLDVATGHPWRATFEAAEYAISLNPAGRVAVVFYNLGFYLGEFIVEFAFNEYVRITGVTSFDPNSMDGPAGHGSSNYVAGDALLPYQVNFENDPGASAPAQRVDITDQLDSNLDWTTLQLTAVGFGSNYVGIPAGLQHYTTTVSMTYNGDTFNVVITINLDPATGILTASFQSIDPGTNLPPMSFLTGFLPPEDGSGRGEGFVSFTILPKVSLATGTQIRNIANVVFDLGLSIATDQVSDEDASQGIDPSKQALATIDAGAPTSSVTALPASEPPTFTVDWAGTDDTGGSGVATYNVYVSDNGSPFTLWQSNTSAASGSFAGTFAHTYSFYSIATDNVGNVEGAKIAAETSTTIGAGPLVLTGAAGDNVSLTFTGATTFSITINGTTTSYSTAQVTKLTYNGPSGAFSEFIFDDPQTTDAYTATQSLTATNVVGTGFEFDSTNVANLYVYVTDPSSTATVAVADTTGSSNFYVDAANGGYSYIADPGNGTYSELSGFPQETITGSGGSTYAYIYSTSNASTVLDPGGSTITAGGVASSFSGFPQVYAVGASDGSDQITLSTEGGSFVGQPSFSYVDGTFNGNSFLIGAVFAANVTAQATNPTDPAYFYSYAGNAFNGAPGMSSLSGSASGFASFATFVTQATGFQTLGVLESGAGTDSVNLTSPGSGSFFDTPTASVFTVGSTSITVNTYFASNGQNMPIASQIVVTGNHDGTDQASIYDVPGNNALTASGSTATLTTALGSLSINKFGSVTANQQNGTDDTVHKDAIDFALQTVGSWTSD